METKRINPWIMLVGGIVFLWLLFNVVGWAFKILAIVAPVLLIAAVIIKYQVVIDYVKWIFGTLKKSPGMGIIYILLTVIAFPVVSAFLLFKAINYQKIQDIKDRAIPHGGFTPKRRDTEFTDFEILDEKPLELPSKAKVEEKRSYDDLF